MTTADQKYLPMSVFDQQILSENIFQKNPVDRLWCVRYYAWSIQGEDVMSFGPSRKIVYWSILDPQQLHLDILHCFKSTNLEYAPLTFLFQGIFSCFFLKWVRSKCIHKFISWVNWSGFDTFGPIFPRAPCQVRSILIHSWKICPDPISIGRQTLWDFPFVWHMMATQWKVFMDLVASR